MNDTALRKKVCGGISGSTVKLLAVAAMVLDHVAWLFIDRLLKSYGFPSFPQIAPLYNIKACLPVYILSYLFHIIGRIAFPLFLFLLTEGVRHTKDIRRYGATFLIFAFASEIPYDLFVSGAVNMQHQNVFFTLFLAMIAVYSIQNINSKTCLRILCIAVCLAAAYFIKCDYGAKGVLLACAMELFREGKKICGAALWAAFIVLAPYEFSTLLVLPLIKAYNGARGWNLKIIFYAFYPTHLLVLYAISLIASK